MRLATYQSRAASLAFVMESAPPSFPTWTSVLTIVATGAALALAALNVRWGLLPATTGQMLQTAWLYVNLSLAGAWFLIWPLTALRRPAAGMETVQHLLALGAIMASAIPALAIAGWLHDGTAITLLPALALQAGFALFVFGLLECRSQAFWADGAVSVISTTLFLLAPMMAYLQQTFAPALARSWFLAAPVVAVYSSSKLSAVAVGWVAGTYAVIGLVLWGFGAALSAV